MNDSSTVGLHFEHEGDTLLADDLGQFLAAFARVYDGAAISTRDARAEQVLADPNRFVAGAVSYFFDEPEYLPSPEPLRISRISYASPLEITVTGVSAALVIALILAGGEVKLFGGSVKMNKSLGEALLDLRRSLRTTITPRVRDRGLQVTETQRGDPALALGPDPERGRRRLPAAHERPTKSAVKKAAKKSASEQTKSSKKGATKQGALRRH